ncbi:hypothetical protein [Bradyrhizobium sp. LeoA1S1]
MLLRHHDRFAPAADYSDRAEDIQSAFTPINVLLGMIPFPVVPALLR